MRVFLSWSGHKSNQIAQVLRDWLPAVIQAARPYFSPDDIAKGARWSTEISSELQESKVGILCVTSENLAAPWLMFEAGALAKSLDRSRVIPLLVDVEPSALVGPLSQFQAAKFDRIDIRRMIKVINDQLGSAALDDSVLDSVFEKWWPDLESRVAAIRSQADTSKPNPTRTDREVLEEVLDLVRDLSFRRPQQRGALAVYAEIQSAPIESLELTERTLEALRSAGVTTVGEAALKTETELIKIPRMGRISLNELKEVLASRGIALPNSRQT
ncbi:TIR domain-containing protein [Polaromonas sp. P1(28)-8]|nr:TIR domain-containing protein [Polaromonas sp. P1(28)-8]